MAYKIPNGWESKKLGAITDLINGMAFKPSDWKTAGLPIVRIQNLNGSLEFNYYTKPVGSRYYVNSGDLLFSWSGSRGTSFGPFIWRGVRGILNQHIFRVVVNDGVDKNYLYHQFKRITEVIERRAHGSAGLVHVTKNELTKFYIDLPRDINEQIEIAKIITTWDRAIETLDKLIDAKTKLKKGLMQKLLTGKMRLPGFNKKWSTKLIGDFTDCTSGGTPNTSIEAYWGGSIKWMSSGELNEKLVEEVAGRITEEGLHNSSTKMIPKKCVLIGLAGQGKTRGTVAMNMIELCTNQSIAAIFPNPTFVPEYLYYNLDSRYDELRKLSTGDGGRGGLNLNIIRSLSVAFPEVSEQLAIARIFIFIDKVIFKLQKKKDLLITQKAGLMQKLLTGKIRVHI